MSYRNREAAMNRLLFNFEVSFCFKSLRARRSDIVTLKLKGGNVNVFLKKHHMPATFTILNFQVDDITKTMEELSREGMIFEHYDGEEDIVTDKKGIAEDGGFKASWFKDPAGNLLQLIEAPAS